MLNLLSLLDFFFFLNLGIVVLFIIFLFFVLNLSPPYTFYSEHVLYSSFGLSRVSTKCLQCLVRSLHFGSVSANISPISGNFLKSELPRNSCLLGGMVSWPAHLQPLHKPRTFGDSCLLSLILHSSLFSINLSSCSVV